jgi:hypothetical protein
MNPIDVVSDLNDLSVQIMAKHNEQKREINVELDQLNLNVDKLNAQIIEKNQEIEKLKVQVLDASLSAEGKPSVETESLQTSLTLKQNELQQLVQSNAELQSKLTEAQRKLTDTNSMYVNELSRVKSIFDTTLQEFIENNTAVTLEIKEINNKFTNDEEYIPSSSQSEFPETVQVTSDQPNLLLTSDEVASDFTDEEDEDEDEDEPSLQVGEVASDFTDEDDDEPTVQFGNVTILDSSDSECEYDL